MNFLFPAGRLAPALKMALTNAAVLGLLLAGGCGKAPEPVAETAPEPAHTPTSAKPSLVVQPPANTPSPTAAPAAARVVYVATAFQAVNSDGTHDFPARAAVNVLAEEGEEYVIEYQGISVRTPKTFFTETLVEEVATPEPSPVPAAPTPDTIPLPSEGSESGTAPVQTGSTPLPPAQIAETAPAATPDPAMAADAAKATELIGEIKTLNDEIRSASDKLEVAPADEKTKEAARIEKLKKRRDRLSENLTEVAKP